MAKKSNPSTQHQHQLATNPIFNKQLGQHILKNPLVAQGIVDKANLLPTDTVFEIGPGTGNLTMKILERAKRVIVVEKDPRLAAELLKRVQGTEYQRKLQVIVGDVLKVDWPYFDVCISNTPYQISSPLTFALLKHRPMFRCAVLMFQREFALRMVAKPGDPLYCRLSVNVQIASKVNHIMRISKNSFRPPPQVESSVVRLEPLKDEQGVDMDEWDGLMRILFSRKNKTIFAGMNTNDVLSMLESSLRTRMSLENKPCDVDRNRIKSMVQECIAGAGLEGARPAKLTLDDYKRLLESFQKVGFSFKQSTSNAESADINMDMDEDDLMESD